MAQHTTSFSTFHTKTYCSDAAQTRAASPKAARHLKTGKRQKENRKGKGGREPTIVIVFFHITTIVGESSQKLNKIGKTFSSRCGVYLAIPRKDKSIKQKTKAGESEEKDKTFSAMWKKTKAFNKSSPFSLLYTIAGVEVSCSC
jgi:hypothetical protein